MRRIYLLLLFLALLAAACGGGADAIPTAAPTVPAELLGEGGASPRLDSSNGIPPTWTPQPTAVQATPEPATADEDEPAPTPSGEGDVHVVQAGETLAEIAIRYGVDLDALVELNGIDNIDHIEVGQELLIPQP